MKVLQVGLSVRVYQVPLVDLLVKECLVRICLVLLVDPRAK